MTTLNLPPVADPRQAASPAIPRAFLGLDRSGGSSAWSSPRVPWVSGVVLFVLFAMANWSWSASQRWYASDQADVSALVGAISDGQGNRQAAFVMMAVFGVGLLALPSGRRLSAKLRVAYPLVLFVGWALLSITWSREPDMTAKRLFVFASFGVTIAGLLKHFDARGFAQIALIAGGLTLAVGACNEARILLVDRPPMGLWRFGGMMHPNHAGLNCCVLLLASQYLFRVSKRKWLLVAYAVAASVLVCTKSRTALMSGVTASAAFYLLAAPPRRLGWSVLIAAWLGAATLWLNSLGGLTALGSLVTLGRDDVKTQDVSQLTGRTDIWKFALMQADKDPNRTFIGYGYETFWTPENARGVSEFVKFKISEGHCCYLDWYLELGLVGVGLYVLILLTALGRWGLAARRLASPSAAVAAAVLCGTIVHGFAESSLGDASLPTLFVYASLAGSALRRPDELEHA